jgi:hypothetical protein
LLKGLQHRFSTKGTRQKAFFKAHSKEIQEFSKKWGNFIADKGISYSFSFHSLNNKPNPDDSEDEEPEESGNEAWRDFLKVKDEVMSLKTLKQAKALGGRKRSLSMALSEFIRQAWSEYGFVVLYFLYLTLVCKNNQAGKPRLPGQILGINQAIWLTLNFCWISHFSTLTGCK